VDGPRFRLGHPLVSEFTEQIQRQLLERPQTGALVFVELQFRVKVAAARHYGSAPIALVFDRHVFNSPPGHPAWLDYALTQNKLSSLI
jgi:hypothetical protein